MDYLRKFARGALCSGAVGAGLLGIYLAYKKRVPDYMGFISCCVGLYALRVYMIEDEETDGSEKIRVENENHGTQNMMENIKQVIQNPKSTCTAASACYTEGSEIEKATFLNDFEEETNKVLENIEKLRSESKESKSVEEIFISTSDFVFEQNMPEEELQLLNKICEKLGEIKAQQEGIVIHISPLKLEKLDLKVKYPDAENSEKAFNQYIKDRIHEFRLDVAAANAEKTG